MAAKMYNMPDGNAYSFESPEEATDALNAWNEQFGKKEDQPPKPEQPESNWYDPDRLAANPITRFASSAASPFLGAMELIPGAIGDYWAEKNKAMSDMVESGKKKQTTAARYLGGTTDLGGMLLSPAFLKLGRALPAAKTGAELMGQGAVVGGVAGLTTPTGQPGEGRAKEHVINTGVGAAGGAILTPVVSKVISGTSNVLSPLFSNKAVDAATGKLAVRASGVRAQRVADELRAGGTSDIAGITALPAKSSEFSALMSLVKGNKGSEYGDLSRTQAAARLKLLESVAPDIAKAEARRSRISNKFYDKAVKAVVTIDNSLSGLFDRMPAGTMERAAEIAKIDNRPFIIGENIPAHKVPSGIYDASGNMVMKNVPAQNATITGESLHYIKRGLSDIVNKEESLIGSVSDKQKASRGLLSDFIKEFEAKVPSYGAARKLYAKLSEPINQSTVIKEMGSILAKPGGGENTAAYLNVLGRGETALLKKSTGFARYEAGDLRKVLTPSQLKVVDKIARDLESKSELTTREAEGMRTALKAMRAAENKDIRAPDLISYKISIFNRMLSAIEGVGGSKTRDRLAELGMPGNNVKLANLMQARINKPQGMMGDAVRVQGGAVQGMLSNRGYDKAANYMSDTIFPLTKESN